jgi:type IV secretory pathway VirB10-like protein
LDSQEAAQVRELKQRDAEVKAHEQAHMAAGGGLVQGAASYTYEKGPDGGMYAVGGEVKIDTSPARTPEQTIRKAQQIRRAALAPAQPSGTDRAVAAAASQMEAQARAEKTREAAEGGEDALPASDAGAAGDPSAHHADQDHADQDRSTPFTAPAIQAYQSAATSAKSARAISTFA